MSAPKALILRAPGINCERETYDAYERAGANSEYLHIKKLLAQPELLDQYSILAVPGGFSYGDVLGAGEGWASWPARLARQLASCRLGDFTRLPIGDRFKLRDCHIRQL